MVTMTTFTLPVCYINNVVKQLRLFAVATENVNVCIETARRDRNAAMNWTSFVAMVTITHCSSTTHVCCHGYHYVLQLYCTCLLPWLPLRIALLLHMFVAMVTMITYCSSTTRVCCHGYHDYVFHFYHTWYKLITDSYETSSRSCVASSADPFSRAISTRCWFRSVTNLNTRKY